MVAAMIGDMPIFSILKSRMAYAQARQKVLAENVSNADTPGYRSKDLRKFDAQVAAVQAAGVTGSIGPVATQSGHLTGSPISSSFDEPRRRGSDPYETVPVGTAVSLEDEMMKIANNQADYQAAATLYSKSLSFLKIAIGKSG